MSAVKPIGRLFPDGLPTGPLAPALETAGGGPVKNPAAYHMPTHPSPPSFRLILELELTFLSRRERYR
jgi:hypothetical protein